jgi:iron complex transport system ATP-binding protein
VRGAVFRRGDRDVLRSIDLDVFRGEVLCILGPNGCGKTTLLRCLGGALTLDAGVIRLEEADIGRLTAADRARRVGFLFQEHTPSFPFTILDLVTMGRAPYLSLFESPHADDVRLAERALERVGVLHLRHRPYTQVSGGERQLVLLARTLAQNPDVILLDEPTSHLDFRNQVLTLKIIRSLAADGMTMVMTTHDPNHGFLFDGRVALMKEGQFVAVGPASEILTGSRLTSTYGVDVAVLSVRASAAAPPLTVCTPWVGDRP